MTEQYSPELKAELLAMAEADQAMRNGFAKTGDWDETIDLSNTTRLNEIIVRFGWPLLSVVGVDVAQSAWLIAQHADRSLDFQADCLEIMRNLPLSDYDPIHLAYLEDRVRVNAGLPQLYGSQFHRENGKVMPLPIEDEASVDERRASVDLGLLADYAREIENIYAEWDANLGFNSGQEHI